MKMRFYDIKFYTGIFESLWSFSFEEAKILAQAQQILKGNQYKVESILCKELDEIHFYTMDNE